MAELLKTERLLLRGWRPEDREPFFRLNSDPLVMRYFPGTLNREDSDRAVDRILAHFERYGFGLYAVEVRESSRFAGFIGLNVPTFQIPTWGRTPGLPALDFLKTGQAGSPAPLPIPCIEIGWRLAMEFWNYGFATEGARAVLKHAFGELALEEVVAFTVPANLPSRRVMEKLGMAYDPDGDFDHPRIPQGHPLRRHVLYRITRRQFNSLS